MRFVKTRSGVRIIVPVAAIAVTVIVVGQVAGLFHLPIGPSTEPQVITMSPDQDASSSAADPD